VSLSNKLVIRATYT